MPAPLTFANIIQYLGNFMGAPMLSVVSSFNNCQMPQELWPWTSGLKLVGEGRALGHKSEIKVKVVPNQYPNQYPWGLVCDIFWARAPLPPVWAFSCVPLLGIAPGTDPCGANFLRIFSGPASPGRPESGARRPAFPLSGLRVVCAISHTNTCPLLEFIENT